MAMYQRKPKPVEAYQVGSKGPHPEWFVECCKKQQPIEGSWVTREVRDKHTFIYYLDDHTFRKEYEPFRQ